VAVSLMRPSIPTIVVNRLAT